MEFPFIKTTRRRGSIQDILTYLIHGLPGSGKIAFASGRKIAARTKSALLPSR